MHIKIEKELLNFKRKFDRELGFFLRKKTTEAKKISPWAFQFVKQFEHYAVSNGGKRIRPALMYFGYLAAGGENNDAIIRASLSVELLHISFLIQDDIMDRDILRHSKPTMHCSYKYWAERNLNLIGTESSHYGISQTICESDIGVAMAFCSLSDSSFDEKVKMRAVGRLCNIVFKTSIGQMSDILAENLFDVKESQVMNILEYKTARYTIFGPLSLGAILAGRSEKYIGLLRDYAVPLGIAFQIRDDILGMFGDSAVTGKPVGADLKEGKKTLLIVHALRKADPQQKLKILKNLGNKNCSEKSLDEVRNILKETGSLAYSEKMAEKLANSSKRALEKLPIPLKSKKILSGIADFVIKRNK